MSSRSLNTAVVAIALASLAPPARADQLTADVPAGTATFSFAGEPAGSPFAGLNGQTFYVGPLTGTLNGQKFSMYCVDLMAEIHPGDSYGVNPQANPATLSGHDLIGRLLSLAPPTNALQGAAMQLAIWDAEYSAGAPLSVPTSSSGTTITTSLGSVQAVFDQANSDLAMAAALPESQILGFTYLAVPSGQYGQSMVTSFGINSVPEPASLVLTGLGLAGACGVRRRRGLRTRAD